ncbi:thioredoxin domain-containing protein [Christiangramia sp. SM2212]|uniref:Thioredoxin domain-containing protein n=1 Tax=Christiangramia sediminicola TaxID=3073267 RepID=A0ABU1EM28_9FLAO|nr:thioredoxin domain-containing protein [Christiangramia sp. SM2212]MDR5589401.1 thioredoxin domain-containing protein [Christiangramia sp. SM2212]
MNKEKNTNELIHETSPYLLQHAHNPVDWKAWNDESLDSAENEDKLLLISVGYSACHWCHVMEHESFEDFDVAEIMNSNYINIKVDREERPDVDQVYMNAVQVMTGMGGWPMNVIALPDGRPVWGGTYFKKEQWMDALKQISHLYKTQPEKLIEYADKLKQGLKQIQIIEPAKDSQKIHRDIFFPIINKWKRSFDKKNGGYQRAPKFMMPNNYEFLMRYAFQNSDNEMMDHCLFTLNKISWGGVFDPIDGGFSRYSVDEKWHVPHFEKMLYDNAQLVRLYSRAYKITHNEWYKSVVEKSLEFIESEMTDASGAFYSALDADSEDKKGHNEEGAYYVWSKSDLIKLLEDNYEIFSQVYNINNFGKWEENKYVLIRTKSFEQLSGDLNLSEKELHEKISSCHEKLKSARATRKKPGLDDKSLTSWNALMISGYTEAFKAFQNLKYLKIAEKNAEFIINNQIQENGNLYHSYKKGKSTINGYLEDYAFSITAFLDLYEATFQEKYLQTAYTLLENVENNFQDKDSGLYFFKSKEDRKLITNTLEINDNVISASNSEMAKNLFRIGKLKSQEELIEKSESMLNTVLEQIKEHPHSYSNWLDLALNFSHPFYEVAITGDEFRKKAKVFQKEFLQNIVIAGTDNESELPILKQRLVKNKNLVYICEKGACQLPLSSESESLQLIRQV